MQTLLAISRWIDRGNQWVGKLTTGLVPLMILLGVWNVVGRYLGRFVGQNLTSNSFLEGQWYLFDLVFLLGAAYTLKHNEHVRVDVFYSQWPPRRQALVNIVGTLFFLLPFCGMVIYFSWDAIAASWSIREMSPDPGGLPRYPIKAMIIICFILLMGQGVSEAIKNWAILQSDPQGRNRGEER